MKKNCVVCGRIFNARGKTCSDAHRLVYKNKRLKKWRLENPERVRASAAKSYRKNIKYYKEKNKKWRLENVERAKESTLRWRAENKERWLENARRHYAESFERMRERRNELKRLRRIENLEEVRKYHRDRHRKLSAAYRALTKLGISIEGEMQ